MDQPESQTSSFLTFGHGGNLLELCRHFNIAPEKAVDFSASINPLGFPSGLDQYLAERLSAMKHYPDSESQDISEAFSNYLGVPSESVLAGNGSMELIDLSIRMIFPRSVSIVQPAFSEYERVAGISGAKIHSFVCRDENGFLFSPSRASEEMKRNMQNSNVLILGNPNNPSGALIEGKDLEELAAFAKKKAKWLIVDEAFIEFAGEEYSLAQKAAQTKRLIVIRSATKFFGIPGLRLGYTVSHPDTVQILRKFQPSWTVNTLAREAAPYLVQDKAFQTRSREIVETERKWFASELERLGWIKVHPSRANFLLCEIINHPDLKDASQLFDELGRKGLFIRACSNFTGLDDRFFRAAIRTREENERLIEALKFSL